MNRYVALALQSEGCTAISFEYCGRILVPNSEPGQLELPQMYMSMIFLIFLFTSD